MSTQIPKYSMLSIPRSLRAVGLVTGSIGVLGIILPTIAYAAVKPGFHLLATYLSDIGATPVWPQILFNSAVLIASPLRYLIVVMLVLRLCQLGAGRRFATAVLIVAVFLTFGTILMTAVPYTVNLTIHKMGIPLYCFGVVILQTLIGVREFNIKTIPRVLPIFCFVVVGIFLVFFILVMLYEADVVGRNTPILWEWLCGISSLVWVFAQSLILGKE